MIVYVDTSALLPLLDRSDDDHASVLAAVRDLASSGATLTTCSYTLVEAGALVKRRLGSGAFKKLGETVTDAMDVIWVDAELHAHAWANAAKHSRHGPSLVDCVSFIVMHDKGITTALALDEHFRAEGFQILP